MGFEGKVALVTGAGRGIGEAIAKLLSRRGAYVACNDSTETCVKTAKEIEDSGGRALPLQFDVTTGSQIKGAVISIIEKFGRIDMLVNNAGGSAGQALAHDMNEETWQKTLDINLKGCFSCSKAVLPSMIKNRHGKIVSIASVRAETGLERDCAYAAAKAGICGFSRSLAREVAQYGINVNVVSPGIIRTQESAVLPWGEYAKIVPLGIGAPEDIAYAVAFLCSDEARYITGQILHVNGGWWPTCK
jgi:3-oxoacyl-[acyl-carrier protein] reductase